MGSIDEINTALIARPLELLKWKYSTKAASVSVQKCPAGEGVLPYHPYMGYIGDEVWFSRPD